MTPDMRRRARQALDRRLSALPDTPLFIPPPRGWIRAIRQALGMTTAQMAKRMGVSQPRIPVLEKAEASGAITLDSLARAAAALDCELVHVFVPKGSLDDQVNRRARLIATRRVSAVAHSMALEAQGVGARETALEIERLARVLAEKSGPELWADE